MAALEFEFQEFLDEIDAISKVAKRFIAPESPDVLKQLHTTLDNYRLYPIAKPVAWGIDNKYPLCTIVSEGGYVKGGKGKHRVFAQITSVWEIAPSDRKATKRRPHKTFCLIGMASTRIHLFDYSEEGNHKPLAMWRMEIGDEQSPGCHFHVQVLGASDDPPFPQTLKIPRLPGLVVTPMAALEFVLGELFQEEWKEHAVKETHEMQVWRPIQEKRLSSLIGWQKSQVSQGSGSPWTVLKMAKPPANLFL